MCKTLYLLVCNLERERERERELEREKEEVGGGIGEKDWSARGMGEACLVGEGGN